LIFKAIVATGRGRTSPLREAGMESYACNRARKNLAPTGGRDARNYIHNRYPL
jgi:hypothetical protein